MWCVEDPRHSKNILTTGVTYMIKQKSVFYFVVLIESLEHALVTRLDK